MDNLRNVHADISNDSEGGDSSSSYTVDHPDILDIFHVNGWEVNRRVHDLNVLINSLRSGVDYVEDETDLDMRDVIIRIASLAWAYSTISTALVA